MSGLVPTDPELCPGCGEPLEEAVADQPALFFHGGYGATERTIVAGCASCGWSLRRERSAQRP